MRGKYKVIIYCAINKKSGKAYVGMTSKSLNERMREHQYYAQRDTRFVFQKAVKKQGTICRNNLMNEDKAYGR